MSKEKIKKNCVEIYEANKQNTVKFPGRLMKDLEYSDIS